MLCEEMVNVVSLMNWVRTNSFKLVYLALLVCTWVWLWYFYCAFDLEMFMYLNEMKHGSNYMDGTAFVQKRPSVGYKSEKDMGLMLHKAYASLVTEVDMDHTLERRHRVAQDLEDLAKRVAENREEKLIMACITRDDWYGLNVNRVQLEELGSQFADYRILVVENDSSEGYRELLNEWARSNTRVKIISKTFNLKKRPDLKFLAKMRNYYIDELRKPEYDSFNRVLMFDMDVSHRWPIQDIVGSTLIPSRHYGVRCFHIYNRNRAHRDVLAFRAPKYHGEFVYSRYPDEVSYGTMQEIYNLTIGWFDRNYTPEVKSCFGGMAVYARDILLQCKYDDTIDQCEHLSMNECIHSNGKTLILDTTVAIPFHYRKVVDGLLVIMLFSSCLPINLFALLPGILRTYYIHFVHDHRRRKVDNFNAVLWLLTSGVVSQFWFVYLAKDNSAVPELFCFVLASVLETITTELGRKLILAATFQANNQRDLNV